MSDSEAKKEIFGESKCEFLNSVQRRITALERELYELKQDFASYMLDMGQEQVRDFHGEELRLVKDAIIRVLALSSEPLTYGQVHERFEQHSKVYGVTRKELRRVMSKLAHGSRGVVRRLRKSATSRVVLYELRRPPKGLWHQGRFWTAAEMARDALLNKHGISERTIRDRMKSAEFIHQVLSAPAVARGSGARLSTHVDDQGTGEKPANKSPCT